MMHRILVYFSSHSSRNSKTFAARRKIEQVDILLLALVFDHHQLLVGVLLPAHGPDAVVGELFPLSQLAGSLGLQALFNL